MAQWQPAGDKIKTVITSYSIHYTKLYDTADAENHSPGIDNRGPFLTMNPFSSRCCQHNHGHAIPYYIENLVMASNDNGLATIMYNSCTTKAKVGNGKEIELIEKTNYPFEEQIQFTIRNNFV